MTPKQIANLAEQKERASGADVIEMVEALGRTYCFTESMIAESIGILAGRRNDIDERFERTEWFPPAGN